MHTRDWTPLHHTVATAQDFDMTERILKRFPEILDAQVDETDHSALMMLCTPLAAS
jgi:hypothetical protein